MTTKPLRVLTLAWLLASAAALSPSDARAALIQFDVPDQDLPYDEQGYQFVASGLEAFDAVGIASGRLDLLTVPVPLPHGVSVDVTGPGGGTFDVAAFDYLVNNLMGVYVVTTDTGEELILDNNGGGTVVVNWTGVTVLTFAALDGGLGASFQIDNVQLTIPEPASLGFLALAAGLLAGRRRVAC